MQYQLLRKFFSPFLVALISVIISVLGYILASSISGDEVTFFWIAVSAIIPASVSYPVMVILLRMLRQIERQHEELERLNLLNQELFSIISHDVRTPLNSLSMLLDMVRSGNMPPEKALELFQELWLNVEHLTGFLDELLIWSKNQIDNKPLTPTHFDAAQVIQDSAKLYSKMLEIKNIDLQMDQISGSVLADVGSYAFVVRNVLQNATKYTPRGGSISVQVDTQNGLSITKIKDTGTGMNQSTIDKIMSQETLESTSGTQQEKGFGFGLQASIRYLAKQQGRLQIQSKPYQGTTVSIILPSN